MLLAGTKASSFVVNELDETLQTRLVAMDIHPTGPLWGRGHSLVQADSLAVEHAVLAGWESWQQGLEKAGMSQERRAMRLYPKDFSWQFMADNQLELSFFLPAGYSSNARVSGD